MTSLSSASKNDQVMAKEIAKELDGLPLALDLAAAYIDSTDCGVSGYFSLYRTHGLKVCFVSWLPIIPTGSPRPGRCLLRTSKRSTQVPRTFYGSVHS